MSKKVVLWFILMLIVVYIVWAIIINIQDSKPNYEIITKGDKTLYKIEGVMYEIVDDSDKVMIETEPGIMIFSVFESEAPITVANFKKLVSEKFYDGIIFHRVIKDFMIQTGHPTGTGTGGSEETIKGEFSENGVENTLSHKRGIVSMARVGGNPETEETYNSASSQFFIVHKDSTSLDGKYAAFGLLLHGYDVLDKIAEVSTDEHDKPIHDQVMKQVRFVQVYREN